MDIIVNNSTIRIELSGNSIMRYLFIGVSLTVVLAVLSITVLGVYFWLPATIHYQISEKYQISLKEGNTSIYLGIILPKNGPYQTVNNIRAAWDGEQEKNSYPYVDMLKLSNYGNGEQELQAIVMYDVILPQGNASWQAPVEKFQILPQVGIESDHPEIEQAALGLADDLERVDAFRIYRFTSNHLSFEEGRCEETNVSALEAYRSKISACIGYSRLMVALCRASGIPAKMIIGVFLPDIFFPLTQISSTGISAGGHAWVEYSSQNTWKMADPSWGKGYLTLLEFNRNDGHHLSYGEFDQFTAAKRDLINWATKQAFPLDSTLTYIFAADSDQATISSETSIRKTWDGRWFNTLLALAVVTFLLSKIRDRLISKNSIKHQHSIETDQKNQ
jgi:hypothetical protein